MRMVGGAEEAPNLIPPDPTHNLTHFLRSKSIVFVGDSLTRYQYLALAFWVEHGKQPDGGENRKKSICNEWSWPDGSAEMASKWAQFYSDTSALLQREV